ncbi:MAG: hypothetical protein PHC40_05420 [Eubacteriales bacterium]|nr:hypothetical protein [Eubacteriales bacterium]
MNYFEKMQQICQERKAIYYSEQELTIKDLFDNLTDTSAHEFIKKYFSTGGKAKAFDLNFSAEYETTGKHIHTVSLYFLGFYLRRIFETEITRKIKFIIPKWGNDWNYKFTYTWFLTCLYHDIATVEEKEQDTLFIGSPSDCLKYYCEKESIKHDVYAHRWLCKDIYPFTYSKTLVENYFLYRRNHCGKIEHGILGGLLQYDRLLKNYNQAWEKQSEEVRGDNKYESFEYNGLKWKIEHLDHFAYIANAIIAHNIWHGDESNLCYKRYGLDNLDDSHKVKFAEDPLTYFLGVVDTIEPTKFFMGEGEERMLKNILRGLDIRIANKAIIIEVLSELPNIEEWFEKINSLKAWLDIEINVLEPKKKIEIVIH